MKTGLCLRHNPVFRSLDRKNYGASFLIATRTLHVSMIKATGAQMARSPALGVMALRTRLIAENATTTQINQRDVRDHFCSVMPARDSTTKASKARIMA